MKTLLMIMRIFGLQQYIIIMQTKKYRRMDFAMSLENFMAWIVLIIMEVARVNSITPLALATEIKKYVKDETRKENQDEPTTDTDRPQEDISDPAVNHRNTDIS